MVGVAEDRLRALERTARAVRACIRCRLHEGRTNAVPGEGPADATVMLVGEAPGKEEDASGRPFVGSAGRILEATLRAAGLRRDVVFITNVVKCRPPGNRTPKADEIRACRPYLLRQIAAVRPKVLVTLGSTALRSLLGTGTELKEARSKPLQWGEVVVVPTYHPAAVLYNRKLERELRRDLRKVARIVRPKKPRRRRDPPQARPPTKPAASSGGVVVRPDGRILVLKRADEET